MECWILPGTHIVSDAWAAYAYLEQWNNMYTYAVVVHQHNFVAPDDQETHMQNVENMWMRAKRKLRWQFGTSDDLFPYYLHKFIW